MTNPEIEKLTEELKRAEEALSPEQRLELYKGMNEYVKEMTRMVSELKALEK